MNDMSILNPDSGNVFRQPNEEGSAFTRYLNHIDKEGFVKT